MTDSWFSYQEFNFTLNQVTWAFKNWSFFQNGEWPPEHKDSGYTNAPGKKQINKEPRFIKSSVIKAEIERRLEYTGLDKFLVIHFFTQGIPLEELSRRYHMNICEIEESLKAAITYISSGRIPRWRDRPAWGLRPFRPGISYQDWLRKRRGWSRISLPYS